jgi:hypothetical protein
MVIIMLKKWARRARLQNWERVHMTLARSVDLTTYSNSSRYNGSTVHTKSIARRRGSLLSKNLVVRLPKRAVGTLLRVSVVEEDDSSLSFHTHTYASGISTSVNFNQTDWAAFNPSKLSSMNKEEKVALAEQLCEMHRAKAESSVCTFTDGDKRSLELFPFVQAIAAIHEASKERMMSILKLTQMKEDSVIFNKGDPGDSMYFVLEGTLGVYVANGKRKVAEMGAGRYFGEVALRESHGKRTATIKCQTDARLAVITRTQFQMLCNDHPELNAVLGSTDAKYKFERRRSHWKGKSSGAADSSGSGGRAGFGV